MTPDGALDLLRGPATPSGNRRLRLGFMPLVDCAPLVVARDLGFAAAEGLELDLVRETSWANVRDRLVLGHFDAAHLLAPMTLAGRLGLGHLRSPLLAPFVFDQGGSSVALTTALWNEGGDWGAFDDPRAAGATLARVVAARAARGAEPITLAVVHPFSIHDQQLRYWIAAAGLDPDRDLQIVVVPPPYMVDAMVSGAVDGVCVGAPWPSLAVEAGVGHILLTGATIWPAAADKVLGVRETFVEREPDVFAALLRALDHAAAWCETPQNADELAGLLARPEIVGVDAAIVARATHRVIVAEKGGTPRPMPGFLRFHGPGATGPINRPRLADGLWIAAQMLRWHQIHDAEAVFAAARVAFSPALWDAALGRPETSAEVDEVTPFDGRRFDARDPAAWLAGLDRQ